MSNFKSQFNANIWWNAETNDGGDRFTRDANALSVSQDLVNGTGDFQANGVFHKRSTLTNGNSDNYDLAGGLVDRFGNSITFVSVKQLAIINLSTVVGATLQIGNGTNPFASWLGAANDIAILPPGGLLVLQEPKAGYVVIAGTADTLKIKAVGGDVTYDIAVIGVTS